MTPTAHNGYCSAADWPVHLDLVAVEPGVWVRGGRVAGVAWMGVVSTGTRLVALAARGWCELVGARA